MNSNNSNTNASVAKVTRSHRAKNSKVARIADAIVDLVKRTDGPVPLNRIDDQVPGFRAPCGPSWCYFIRHNTGEVIIWNGMTKAGYKALRHVLHERKVALQFVNVIPYVLEDVACSTPLGNRSFCCPCGQPISTVRIGLSGFHQRRCTRSCHVRAPTVVIALSNPRQAASPQTVSLVSKPRV